MGEFAEMLDDWMLSRRRRKRLATELHARYEDAWATGDIGDRLAVLTYIMFTEEEGAAPIILAALRTEHPRLAGHAGAVALSFVISKDFDLGGDARRAFEDYGKRHPSWSTFAAAALDHFDWKEKPDRAFIAEVTAIAKEKHLRVGVVCTALANELAAAYTEYDSDGAHIFVKVDRRAGVIRVYRVFDVVKRVANKMTEKTVKDARRLRADAVVGETVLFESSAGFQARRYGTAIKAAFLDRLRSR